MSTDNPENALLSLTAGIVSAHVANNSVPQDDLPDLIRSVYAALSSAGTIIPAVEASPLPAVPIKKSVFPDYIVCLEDGKKLKMLKRHLQTSYGLTPDAYRVRWNLPPTYPMVAPNYASHRSTLAKKIGLGRKPEAVVMAEVPVQKIPAGKRGRKPGSPKTDVEMTAVAEDAA